MSTSKPREQIQDDYFHNLDEQILNEKKILDYFGFDDEINVNVDLMSLEDLVF